jgi:hypothetical protein
MINFGALCSCQAIQSSPNGNEWPVVQLSSCQVYYTKRATAAPARREATPILGEPGTEMDMAPEVVSEVPVGLPAFTGALVLVFVGLVVPVAALIK